MELPIVPLEVRRGDSYSFSWKIKNIDGTYFVPSTNDEVIFGIKRNRRASNYLIKKIYTLEDFVDSGFNVVLSSDETANFLPSEYEYDIGVKVQEDSESFSFHHIIGISPFKVIDSITTPENE